MADFGCPSCAICCNAADMGVHDYCLPCDTNPACPRCLQIEHMQAQVGNSRTQRATSDLKSNSSSKASRDAKASGKSKVSGNTKSGGSSKTGDDKKPKGTASK